MTLEEIEKECLIERCVSAIVLLHDDLSALRPIYISEMLKKDPVFAAICQSYGLEQDGLVQRVLKHVRDENEKLEW